VLASPFSSHAGREKTILPRALRKPVRILSRLQFEVPQWKSGPKSRIGCSHQTAVYWIVIGGQPRRWLDMQRPYRP